MQVESDDILFRRLTEDNDRSAFDALFRRYYPRIRAYCIRFVGEEDADDVAQDSFLSLWNSIHSYQDGAFKSLIFTIAHNACLNLLKHKAIIDFKSKDDEPQGCEALYINTFANDADESLLMDELRQNIDNVIAELPPRTKEAFLYSRCDELNYSEIAAKMSISVKAVEKHISKALVIMRKRLLCK